MPYAFVQAVENSQVSGTAALAAPSITLTAHNLVLVVTSQNPGSIATLTDTTGCTFVLVGHGALNAGGLFLYYCQDAVAGANVITGHSNGSDFSSIWVGEYSGLLTVNPLIAAAFAGKNGPGNGLNSVTAGLVGAGITPCMIFGFAIDNTGTNVPAAGTSPIAFTGQGAVWANYTGGVRAQAEDARIIAPGGYAATFGSTAGGASHGGDQFVMLGATFAEIGSSGPTLLGQALT